MTPPTLKPKRGAPYGNKNRQRHGRYARPPLDTTSPVDSPSTAGDDAPAGNPSPVGDSSPASRLSLVQEISYLRAYMLRAAIIGAASSDLERNKDVLRILSLAATALTRLVHTENWLSQASGIHVQRDELPAILARMESINQKVLAGLQSKRPRLPASNLEQVAAQVARVGAFRAGGHHIQPGRRAVVPII